MALFIIYTNLTKDIPSWEATLKYLQDFKHQVCIVTNDAEATRARLSAMGNLAAIPLLERKEGSCSENHLKAAKELTGFAKTDIIVALPKNAKPENLQEKIPEKNIVIIGESREDPYFYKKPGTQDHFEKLIQLSYDYKHSNSEEFAEIRELLERINMELRSSWPITPKETLQQEKAFLLNVLMLADNFTHRTCEECLSEVEADYTAKGRLAAVVGTSPNVPVLNWGIFKPVLTFNTSTGELLQKVKKRVDERKKEVVAPVDQQTEQDSRKGPSTHQKS